jgi:hypothetical protein
MAGVMIDSFLKRDEEFQSVLAHSLHGFGRGRHLKAQWQVCTSVVWVLEPPGFDRGQLDLSPLGGHTPLNPPAPHWRHDTPVGRYPATHALPLFPLPTISQYTLIPTTHIPTTRHSTLSLTLSDYLPLLPPPTLSPHHPTPTYPPTRHYSLPHYLISSLPKAPGMTSWCHLSVSPWRQER